MSEDIAQSPTTHFTLEGIYCAVCKAAGINCNKYEIFNFEPRAFKTKEDMINTAKNIKKECVMCQRREIDVFKCLTSNAY